MFVRPVSIVLTRSICALVVLITTVSLACGFSEYAYGQDESPLSKLDGYGTEDYPYLINSISDLEAIREELSKGNSLEGMFFALAGDLDYGDSTCDPLANSANGASFKGCLDGRGHVISGFNVTSKEAPASFFGAIDGAVINLTLNGSIRGDISASFATQGSGAILNCASMCDVEGSRKASGIVDNWEGLVRNVVFVGSLEAPAISNTVDLENGSGSYAFRFKPYSVIETNSASDDGQVVRNTDGPNVVESLNNSSVSFFLESSFGKYFNSWVVVDGMPALSSERMLFEGNGSWSNPYEIDSVDKLLLVKELLSRGFSFHGSTLIQTQDIDIGDYQWDYSSDGVASFLGTYDGNGHTVTGLHSNGAAAGLFDKLDGIVINLGLDDCSVGQGVGFAAVIGEPALVINSFIISNDSFSVSDKYANQFVNCYLEGFREPTSGELNSGLEAIVNNYGIHCGELKTWADEGSFGFGASYKDVYLLDGRRHWEGSGVERDPYLIKNLADFVYMRELVFYNDALWDTWFRQAGDISFSEVKRWAAISGEYSESAYSGIYDGDGFCLMGFSSYDEHGHESGTIFGNVRNGTIMNVHIIDCVVAGEGNGLLAYNVYGKGKVINNVIEVNADSSEGSFSLLNENRGRAFNNLIVLRDATASFMLEKNPQRLTDSNGNAIETQKYNQVVNDPSEAVVSSFNDNMLEASVALRQRITNLNLLTLSDGLLSLQEKNPRMSVESISYYCRLIKGNVLLLLAVIWLIGCLVFGVITLIRRAAKRHPPQRSTLVQINIVIGIHLLFIGAEWVSKPESGWSKGFAAISALLVAVFLVNCVILVLTYEHKKGERSRVLPRDLIPIAFALLVTCVISVMHFDTPVAYDADLYYGDFINAMRNFDFSIASILDGFALTDKPMYGIVILMAIGEFFAPGTAVGLYFINTILLLLAQAAVYGVLKMLFPRFSSWQNAILSVCFSFSGYVVAGATYINPDFYAVVTFACFVYCLMKNKKVLCLYCAFLFICSKQNMAVSYLLFVAVYLMHQYKVGELNVGYAIALTVPLAVVLTLHWSFSLTNAAWGMTEMHQEFSVFFGSRMLQYFAFGFIWFQEILALFAIAHLIRRRQLHIISDCRQAIIFAIWIACFAQLLALLYYGGGLAQCPRYFAICAIKNTVLFALALDVLPRSRSVKTIVPAVFSVVLAVQLFWTIDPSILICSEKGEDGLHYLVVSTAENDNGNDLTFYNFEYANEAKAAGQVLSRLSKSEVGNLASDAEAKYELALGSSGLFVAYWDTANHARTYIWNDDCIRLDVESMARVFSTRGALCLNETAVLLRDVDPPLMQELLGERDTVTIGSITAYRSIES